MVARVRYVNAERMIYGDSGWVIEGASETRYVGPKASPKSAPTVKFLNPIINCIRHVNVPWLVNGYPTWPCKIRGADAK
jgi:hypothetical protein